MKLIGIVGWNTGDNGFGITKAYAEFFAQYGQIIILGPSKEIVPNLDLVVMPGGKDVSSFIYGEVPSFYNTDADLMKEFFLRQTLPAYIEAGIPIFGICLGMQQLAVHFGCKMLQHVVHPYSDSKNRGELVHKLTFLGQDTEAFLRRLEPTVKGKWPQMSVNSLHHQAVDPESILQNRQLIVAAVSDTGKSSTPYPEIIKHVNLPIWGVQYHPEEIYDYPSHNIITSLLNHARQVN